MDDIRLFGFKNANKFLDGVQVQRTVRTAFCWDAFKSKRVDFGDQRAFFGQHDFDFKFAAVYIVKCSKEHGARAAYVGIADYIDDFNHG